MLTRACPTCSKLWRSARAVHRVPVVAQRAMVAAVDASDPVLLYCEWANKQDYVDLLRQRGMNIVEASAIIDWDAVRFAVCWNPPPGMLSKCRHLQAVMSLGAGVDSLLKAGAVPPGLPILRIVDRLMAQRMATWVLWGVITWQRRFLDYRDAQSRSHWSKTIEGRSNLDNCHVRVGVLGAGVMGAATAAACHSVGYKVSAWSRSPRNLPGIKCYHGAEQLQLMVSQCDVLVCLLPLTPHTKDEEQLDHEHLLGVTLHTNVHYGCINSQLLSWLPRGAAVINGGRGAHVVEEDLLQALDSGQVGLALLDVFTTEPLPPESPFWTHPRVVITPHVASMTTLETAADQIAANYHHMKAGQGPLEENLVDQQRGY